MKIWPVVGEISFSENLVAAAQAAQVADGAAAATKGADFAHGAREAGEASPSLLGK